MVRTRSFLACGFAILFACAPVRARTIELTDLDADRFAVIGPEAPRFGWASSFTGVGQFTTENLTLRPRASVLVRIPLDKIPAGQRITRAEWVLMPTWSDSPEPHVYVWRVIGEWGVGCCFQYRAMRPQPVEWTTAGARGAGTDRADRPSAVAPVKLNTEMIINVTADVEMWYGGGAPNNGWMFTVEEEIKVNIQPPCYTTRGMWKLRITYEPQ